MSKENGSRLNAAKRHYVRHGHTTNGGFSPTYSSWHSMIERCTNPNCRRYADYGGRGITVCERWLRFENFLEDMGEKPEDRTIDRIQNALGYFKANCRWATQKEQQANKRVRKESASGIRGVIKYRDRPNYFKAVGNRKILYTGHDFNAAVEARQRWEKKR